MAIALGGRAAGRRQDDVPEMVLGSYTALAESAWMAAAQASDVLESLRAAPVGVLAIPIAFAVTASIEMLLLGTVLLLKLRRLSAGSPG
jgi:hypothetical protein